MSKYYQENKERLQKKSSLQKVTKISQKMQKINWLSKEKYKIRKNALL